MAKKKVKAEEVKKAWSFFCRVCKRKGESDYAVERCECGSEWITLNDFKNLRSYILPMDKDKIGIKHDKS